MAQEASLERIAGQLYRASRTLDDCATLIRDLEFNHTQNIRRIANALAEIIEIEMEIWNARPELRPRFVQDVWTRPREPRLECIIRPAVPTDEAAVLALIEELFEPPGERSPDYSRERGREGFRVAVEHPEADVLLALDGDVLVGLASVYLDLPFIRFGKRCWLQDLVVMASRRSEGIGKLLLDAATEWARERGCTHMELASGIGRLDAHRFYLREGMAQGYTFTRRIE